MTITEKTAYLKGLADGLGVDPDSKQGRLWAALNDLLSDIAHDLEELHETDRGQAEALDGLADEVSYLEEMCAAMDEDDYEEIEDDEEEDGEETESFELVEDEDLASKLVDIFNTKMQEEEEE